MTDETAPDPAHDRILSVDDDGIVAETPWWADVEEDE